MLNREFVLNNIELIIENQKRRNRTKVLDKIEEYLTFDVQLKKLLTEKANLDISLNNKEEQFLNKEIDILEEKMYTIELSFANLLDESVPDGKSEDDNIVVKKNLKIKKKNFPIKSHIDIGKELSILDFDRADKVSEHMNVYYLREGAQLERAVYNFMLDTHTLENNYDEMIPPYIVNYNSMQHSGLYPDFYSEFFHTDFENFSLIPSAAIPMENFHGNEIINEESLPIKYVALSPCFRVEHGDCVE